ncbi:bromodomain-containing protein 7-like isoform X2 [Procambarus clarkii]|uniref:bromodomain-containing protein 7-like isoform X2 n=1 Tax=Procambarus clarkii TaxID=6728 RepID=UPI003743F505
MEKTPLKLKLKLGSGGPSTPEQKTASSAHPTIISNMADEDQGQMASDEELEEEECIEDAQGEEEPAAEEEGRSRSRHSHHDEGAREKHKKSKKKKKKKEREKDKERHKHRHHREKTEGEDTTEEPPLKKQHLEVGPQLASPSKDSTSPLPKPKEPSSTLEEESSHVYKSCNQWQQLLEHLLIILEKKDPQQFFAWPVTDAIAPGYSSIISQPMDFSTIKLKIQENAYSNLKEFQSDFELMCNNCMTYNQQDTIYYKAAKKLLHLGQKCMIPEKILALRRELPSMTTLSKEQLGFDVIPPMSSGGEIDDTLDTEPMESMDEDTDSKEPHSKFEAVQDDMTSEEILEQVQNSASEAAEKLTLKKPASTLGFLRQRGDGTTSLSFLTGCEGNDPNLKEKPVSLGLLTGKLTQGSAMLHNFRDDKRSMAKPIKPLYYGSYSSFCPSYDSTFANLTKEESEMVYATYGNETAVQYAKSICDFSQDCDMAMHLVDQLLNLLTHQQHSRTKSIIEERRRMQEEEERINSILCPGDSGMYPASTDQKGHTTIDFSSLRSLTELGIDTNFINHFEDLDRRENQINTQLEENAVLLENLAKEQKDRLSRQRPTNLNNLPHPSPQELKLVEKVTDGLAMVAKQATPGALAPVPIVRRAMGITMHPVASEPSEQIEVDIEGTSSQEEATPPPPPGSGGTEVGTKGNNTDLESQLRHILNQADAASPPPVIHTPSDMTDKKLKEILGN